MAEPIYTVTTIRIVPFEDMKKRYPNYPWGDNFGGWPQPFTESRTVGWFHKKDDAFETLDKDIGKLIEAGWYKYAVVEEIHEGLYPSTTSPEERPAWWWKQLELPNLMNTGSDSNQSQNVSTTNLILSPGSQLVKPRESAGLLMYRIRNKQLEMFLAHPGGPWYWNRDNESWGIPKGQRENTDIDLFSLAKREFQEETGIEPPSGAYIYLGTVTQKDGRIVYCWAFRKNFEGKIISNTFHMTYPEGTYRRVEFPEMNDGRYFLFEQALLKISKTQVPFLRRMTEFLKTK